MSSPEYQAKLQSADEELASLVSKINNRKELLRTVTDEYYKQDKLQDAVLYNKLTYVSKSFLSIEFIKLVIICSVPLCTLVILCFSVYFIIFNKKNLNGAKFSQM